MSFRTIATILLFGATAAAQTPAPVPAQSADPKQLSVGKEGLFRPGALLQAWYFYERQDADNDTSAFRIRRAELSVKGQIVPNRVAYRVMFDPAKVLETEKKEVATPDGGTTTVNSPVERVSVFQDMEITFLHEWADVSAGQFKTPVSWEGYNSSSKLLFPERAAVSREYGDKRDIGLKAEKKFARFGYVVGLFNGTELNNRETDDAKDLAVRLEAYPIDGLTVAGVVYATMFDRDKAKKDRYEGDVRFERGPFLLQGEYIRANDNGTSAHGAYGALGWTFADRIQPIFRVGMIDPNVDADVDPTTDSKKRDEATIVEGGINYYIQKHEAKLQLSVSRFGYDDRDPVTTLVTGAQVAF